MKPTAKIPLSIGVLLILCFRIWHVFMFNALGNDKSHQLHGAWNMLHGKGYSEAFLPDLQHTSPVVTPLSMWPVGYSAIVAATDHLVNDVYTAQLLVDVFFAAVLAVSMLGIFLLLNKGRISWLFGIYMGVSFAPFHYLTSSDLIAVACFVAAAYFFLVNMQSKSWFSWRTLLLICLLSVTPLIRYAYAPYLLVFAAWGAWIWWKERTIAPLLVGLAAVMSGFLFRKVTNSCPSGQINRNA